MCTFLEPYTKYQIFIFAKDKNNIEGEYSDTIDQYTDVEGPGPPFIINATCVPGTNGTSIFLQWNAPTYYYKSVDEYNIYIKGSDSFQKINVSSQNNSYNISVC